MVGVSGASSSVRFSQSARWAQKAPSPLVSSSVSSMITPQAADIERILNKPAAIDRRGRIGREKGRAPVVIAQAHMHRQFDVAKNGPQGRIFLRLAPVDQIARRDDRHRPRLHGVDGLQDGAQASFVALAIHRILVGGDVQIGDLRNRQHRLFLVGAPVALHSRALGLIIGLSRDLTAISRPGEMFA